MNVRKAHCFFEQSGVFKNEFIKLGIPAQDYDIRNDFGQTDHVIDLFAAIRGGYDSDSSVFDNVSADDLVIAFFPCIRFEDQILLWFRGECYSQRNWSDLQKVEHAIRLHAELSQYYELWAQLVAVCLKRGIRLILENPNTPAHYMKRYFPIKPSVIDKNRTENGDLFKKSTQYWFINCVPANGFVFEAVNASNTNYKSATGKDGIPRQVVRSMISKQYANRFIRTYILGNDG